jgi:hypothetical protein
MMDVSRDPSVDTLRRYVRNAELFQDHAGAGLLQFHAQPASEETGCTRPLMAKVNQISLGY